MALIGIIQQKTKLLISVVAIALLFFMIRELFAFNPFAHKELIVGVVDGKKITLKEFRERIEIAKHNFFVNYERSLPEEEMSHLRDQIWQQLIEDIIYPKLFKQLAIQVTEDELVDMVQGEHIHPDLQAAFIDPATKEFNKEKLVDYLKNLSSSALSEQLHWHHIEERLSQSRCQEKLKQLLIKSLFVNNLEISHKTTLDHTKVNLRYVYVPYQSVPNEQVNITEKMVIKYFEAHAKAYPVKEQRYVSYVMFPIVASQTDKQDFEVELATLKQNFIEATEDSLFASLHTEGNAHQVFFNTTDKDLPPALISIQSSLKKGAVVGPIEDEKRYKLYKVTHVDIKNPAQKAYGITVIEKALVAGDQTKDNALRKAEDFAEKATNLHYFNLQANQDSLQIHTAHLSKKDTTMGCLHDVRDLIRWLYTGVKVGKVSEVFEFSNHYVVAVVTGQTKKGVEKLDHVKKQVKAKVMDLEKAKLITEKLAPIAHLSLDTLAVAYGNDAKILTAIDLKYSTPTLQGVGMVKKVIPQAFVLAEGNRSKIIAEPSAVVLFDVERKQLSASNENLEEIQKQQIRIEQFKQTYQLPKALAKLFHTKDYRYKYY